MSFKQLKMLTKLMKNQKNIDKYKFGSDYFIHVDDNKIIIDCMNNKVLAKKIRKDLEHMILLHLRMNP